MVAAIIAGLGVPSLPGRGGASISWPPAGFFHLPRERGPDVTALSYGLVDGVASKVQGTR